MKWLACLGAMVARESNNEMVGLGAMAARESNDEMVGLPQRDGSARIQR